MINKIKVLLVCSPYYKDITNNLINGATDVLKSNLVDYKIINVPGALEIAPAIKLFLDKSLLFDGFIALGCVIKGETSHFDLICSSTFNAILNLSINFNKPIGNGIITAYNKTQALHRCKNTTNKKPNKGSEAANAVMSILQNGLKKI